MATTKEEWATQLFCHRCARCDDSKYYCICPPFGSRDVQAMDWANVADYRTEEGQQV